MVHTSAEDVKADLKRRLGSEGGELAFRLRDEVLLLVMTWDSYVALFGTNAERIEVFNAASSQVGRLIRRVTWENVILRIGRLTDPPAAAKKPYQKNITIQRMPDHVWTCRDFVPVRCSC